MFFFCVAPALAAFKAFLPDEAFARRTAFCDVGITCTVGDSSAVLLPSNVCYS
jgi:hypothetical protein